jgi:hypothetical protein
MNTGAEYWTWPGGSVIFAGPSNSDGLSNCDFRVAGGKGHNFTGKALNKCRFSILHRADEQNNPRIAKGLFNLLFNKSRVYGSGLRQSNYVTLFAFMRGTWHL